MDRLPALVRHRLLLAALLLLPLPAMAQPLAQLASADTIVTLSFTPQSIPIDTLGSDLGALDWAGAGRMLETLATVLASQGGPSELEDMLGGLEELGQGLEQLDQMMAQLAMMCPALEGVLPGVLADPLGLFGDTLLAVSMTPFNPLPAVTAFARVSPESQELAAGLHGAIGECFSDAALDQDGTTIYIIGDGSDMPLAITAIGGDVYVAGTNPDVVRSAIRLAAGGDESSLADTGLWQQSQRMRQEGIGFGINFAALAGVLEGTVGAMAQSPEEQALLARAGATLRTLGGVAGRISIDPEGLLSETVMTVDPAGGDAALAELILCSDCAVTLPPLAPAQSLGVSSFRVPLSGLFDYLQTWLDEFGPLMGQELDLKAMLLGMLGLDLDRALLGWIGDEVHTVNLESIGPDLRTILYQPGMALLVPVSSEEAARDGLQHFGEVLEPLLPTLLSVLNPLGAMAGELDMGGLESMAGAPVDPATLFAIRSFSYRDIEISRLQASFNVDIATAFLGDHLVVATPAHAIEPIIDTFLGAPSILDDPGYQAARAAAPEGATAFGYADGSAGLRGLAELAELTSQPLAFGILNVLQIGAETTGDGGFAEEFFGFVNLTGVVEEVLPVPASLGSELTEADANASSQIARYYRLEGLNPGDSVTVVLTSEVFDTYLYLVDPDQETYLAADDDSPDTTRSEMNFVAEAGISYWVEVTSFGGFDTGPYQLEISVMPGKAIIGEPEAEAPLALPSYAEALNLTELMPNLLAIIADHLGTTTSSTSIEGNTVYSRSLMEIRW